MVYFVEDDSNIRELVVYTLNATGIKACGFSLPSLFWAQTEKEVPALVILDIMLPEQDGLSILRRLKSNSKTSNIPVMLVSAKDTEYDKVMGLELGADDYLSKPFGMLELCARVKALLRRFGSRASEYTAGSVKLYSDAYKVTVNDSPVDLTLKEYEVLYLLFKNKGSVLTREVLLNSVWGYDFEKENRTVDVHVHSLRAKLGEAGNIIKTVRGVGYIIGGDAD